MDYAKITPFHESGDTPQNESYPDHGWAEDVFVPGDVNGDGDFNVSDLLILQKWLLSVPETHLANWRSGDLCNDERLDASDLCCAREMYTDKATPHRDCGADTQSDFSADCAEILQAY